MIFNIFLSQSAYFRLLIGSVKSEVITAPSSGSGVITFYLQVINNKRQLWWKVALCDGSVFGGFWLEAAGRHSETFQRGLGPWAYDVTVDDLLI